MQSNRWFALRHPDGFSPEMFEHFKAQCRIWQADVEDYIAKWDEYIVNRGFPKPEYIFFEPTLSDDKRIATLPLGGELDYNAVKTFEDRFPQPLYEGFPLPFRLGIELGRNLPELGWTPLYNSVENIRIDKAFSKYGEMDFYIWKPWYRHWFYCWTRVENGIINESEDIGPCETRREIAGLLNKYWDIELETDIIDGADEHKNEYMKIKEKELLIRAREIYFEAAHTSDKRKKQELYLQAYDLFEELNQLGYLGFLSVTSGQWDIARQRAGK